MPRRYIKSLKKKLKLPKPNLFNFKRRFFKDKRSDIPKEDIRLQKKKSKVQKIRTRIVKLLVFIGGSFIFVKVLIRITGNEQYVFVGTTLVKFCTSKIAPFFGRNPGTVQPLTFSQKLILLWTSNSKTIVLVKILIVAGSAFGPPIALRVLFEWIGWGVQPAIIPVDPTASWSLYYRLLSYLVTRLR